MSQTQYTPSRIETGSIDGSHSPSSNVARNQLSQPPQENFDYDDSSWPLYSMYCNVAREDDNKITERCQKDTDGTLVFTGLFAATVGTLLTVSIPDLKPNSQDTSAFYLENIYQLFASANLSDATIPPTLAKPPAFSPPRYAIWVNLLWFLSLAISLSGAIVATLGQQWAHRYITITQHPRYTPNQRARIRTVFAKKALEPYAIWGAGLTPLYLHVSFFLFLAGGLIYLFNLNRFTFWAVVSWVVFAMGGYAVPTVIGILGPEDLFYTPFSPSAFRLYLGVSKIVLQLCTYITPLRSFCADAKKRYHDLSIRYSYGFVEGKWTMVEDMAAEPSSEIDGIVIERTLLAMDNDDALRRFFDAIPGFCKSRLYQDHLPLPVQTKIREALYGFLRRTFSSDSLSDSDKSDGLITCLNVANAAFGPEALSKTILEQLWNQVPQSIEMGHALTRWCTGKTELVAEPMRWIVASILATVRERDDHWLRLASDVFGLPERALRGIVDHGDSALLSILIHITRQSIRSGSWTPWVLSSQTRFNIRDTLPGLQNDFCALWNENVLRAREYGDDGRLRIDILRKIRHSYMALHHDTDAAPVSFSSSTDDDADILSDPQSYPVCTIEHHRSDSVADAHLTTSPTVPPPTVLEFSSDATLQVVSVSHPPP